MTSSLISGMSPKGYNQVTSLSGAVAIGTPPIGSGYAIIQCEAQPVRWRDDGTSPTASVGMMLNVGEVLVYDGALLSIKFIETVVGAKLNVSFYG